MRTFYITCACTALWFLTSCTSYTPIYPAQFAQVETDSRIPLDELRRKVTSVLEDKRPRILLLEVEDIDEGGNNMGQVATLALHRQLVEVGAEIIDRDIPDQLRQELILIEQTGLSEGGSYDEIADYLFRGRILNSSIDSNYSPASTWKDKEGKSHRSPSRCTVTVRTDINIGFYSMNPLQLIRQEVFDEPGVQSYEGVSSCRGKTGETEKGLSVQASFDKKGPVIKNLLAPKGFIYGHRGDGKKDYYEVAFPSSEATDPGTEVVVYKEVTSTHPVTQKSTTEKVEIAEGVILDTPGSSSAWIELKGEQNEPALLGDVVEIHYKSCNSWNLLCDLKLPSL